MKVHTAQLPGDGRNADRLFVTERAVVLLDGASSFEPIGIDPGAYADALGQGIATRLYDEPDIPIAHAVAQAITDATDRLHLTPGRSPSSTVSVLRTRDRAADLYVLGDSPILYGTATRTAALLDDRLTAVGQGQHEAYATALRAGRGFDDCHRATLAELQLVERQHGNTEPGYWIAATDPAAAHHALTTTLAPDDITWAVIAATARATSSNTSATPGRTSPATMPPNSTASSRASTAGRNTTTRTASSYPEPKANDKTIAAIPSVW